jgi:hypothetical protein
MTNQRGSSSLLILGLLLLFGNSLHSDVSPLREEKERGESPEVNYSSNSNSFSSLRLVKMNKCRLNVSQRTSSDSPKTMPQSLAVCA